MGKELPVLRYRYCQGSSPRTPVPKKDFSRQVHAPWIWPAYYIFCSIYIINGAASLLMATVGPKEYHSIVGIVAGSIGIIFGLGLLFRVELFRGIANFILGLNLIFGLFGLAGLLLGGWMAGAMGLVWLIKQIFDLAVSGFGIYLIGETEARAPNI